MPNPQKERVAKYIRFYSKAKPDPLYPSGYRRELVQDSNRLMTLFKKLLELPAEKQIFAVDTETTGLNSEVDHIVGFSFCYEPTTAYYVPVRHKVGTNMDPWTAFSILASVLKKVNGVFFFNKKFDRRFLRNEGIQDYTIKTFDAQIPIWVWDTNIRFPDLKDSAEYILGWKMQTYDDVSNGEVFDLILPEAALDYAADDALATYHLTVKTARIRAKYKAVIQIDEAVVDPVMWMEDTPVRLRKELLKSLRRRSNERLVSLEKSVFEQVGYAFKINGPQQLSEALLKLGLQTREKTGKTQQMSTREAALAEIKDDHPVVGKIIEFKKEQKFLNSYIEPLLKNYRDDLEGGRFSYLLTAVPSGRLASGSEKKNEYFIHVNTQSIPKPKSCYFLAKYQGEDWEDEYNVLGWKFTPIDLTGYKSIIDFRDSCSDSDAIIVEGLDPEHNIRRAFLPQKDSYWVSIDFSGQELRIPANLSGEPTMVNAFLNHEDLHRNVAVLMWGKENYNNTNRKYAKALNFGALYGGSKYTFARTLHCSPGEAQRHLTKWWSTLPVLRKWVDFTTAKAKKDGYIQTIFGRPRRLKYWFSSPSWKDVGYAKRSAINHPVQGTGADLIRLVLCRIWTHLIQNPETTDFYRLISAIHDETNSSVHRDKLYVLVPILLRCMQIEIPGWVVPMEVSLELGKSWGAIFPFTQKEGRYVPDRAKLD